MTSGPDAALIEHMEPPPDADRILGDLCCEVRIDREALLDRLRVAFEPGKHWHDLMEAERVATEIVADAWGDLAADCDRALAELHERYLVRAARVLEAQRDLVDRGSESWVAGGVIHHHAFQLAWDILDEHGLLSEY
jgi:hypothetical protein